MLVPYLISLVLNPLFHQHPGEHHPGSTNVGYHSHTEPFASHTSEHSEGFNQDDATPHHFGETLTLFEDMLGVVQVNQDYIINPAKFSPVLVLFIQSFAERYFNQLSWQDAFNLLALQPLQDYRVLTATNLSPPQA